MLLKSSELLEKFIESEVKKIADVHMPHMPTLGSAYEEITKQGIFQDFAIPKQLDLRVVSGFVVVGSETLPEQIDCMLVHGKGTRYGLGDQYSMTSSRSFAFSKSKKTWLNATMLTPSPTWQKSGINSQIILRDA
ncbi:hypothetical protein ACTACM_24360 [Pseudomonas fragariae (ex Marin et al. 2024)]|uniref:hypothetical protein n=1 Tax=Pseudomonas fragariae (ex Marin et al. 2024) TaxID=3080056 RepID=UPI003F7A5B80